MRPTRAVVGTTKSALIALLAFWLVGFTFPERPQGRINDYAGLLDTQQVASLDAKSAQVSREANTEAIIAIAPTLDGEPIENVAVDLFKKWGVGRKGQDNGALLVIDVQGRAMRIEVGYGLEPVLTDAWSAQTIRNVLAPAFRQQRFYEGFNIYLQALQARVQGKEPPPEARPQARPGQLSPFAAKLIFILILILFIPAVLLRGLFGGSTYSSYGRRRHHTGVFGGGGWGGGGLGGGGGGFGGFGGGSSGGGGASGRW